MIRVRLPRAHGAAEASEREMVFSHTRQEQAAGFAGGEVPKTPDEKT
jgi:hypothetical protein